MSPHAVYTAFQYCGVKLLFIYLFISAKAILHYHYHRQAANNLTLSEMLIQALIQAQNPTHCLILGDNYNTIDWNLCISKRDADDFEKKLYRECVGLFN